MVKACRVMDRHLGKRLAVQFNAGFFETVLNIERDAILIGQKETFLLFQGEDWRSEQDRYFDQARIEPVGGVPRPPQRRIRPAGSA